MQLYMKSIEKFCLTKTKSQCDSGDDLMEAEDCLLKFDLTFKKFLFYFFLLLCFLKVVRKWKIPLVE